MSEEMIFTCPHCQSQTALDRAYVGKSGPCFHCGKRVRIESKYCQPTVDSSPVNRSAIGLSPEEAWANVPPKQGRFVGIGLWLRAVLASILLIALIIGISAGVYYVVLPAMNLDEKGQASIADGQSLELVMNALRQYHDDYGQFPPHAVYDEAGVPLYGWRALLIPYLSNAEDFIGYSYDKAWDSTENAEFHSLPCREFEGDSEGFNAGLHRTSFMRVVGSRTMTPANGSLSETAAVDGRDRTLLVVQVEGSMSHWLAPDDLDMEEVLLGIGNQIGSDHADGFWYATVDGQTHWHEGAMEPEVLRSLLQRADGQPLELPR